MLFTTTTQYVALAIALVAGWLFGLASHPGGRKWKQRYADEREAHAATRRDVEARLAAEAARNAELERENARLAKAAPVTAATIAPRAQVLATPATPPRPTVSPGTQRGWFDWSDRPARYR